MTSPDRNPFVVDPGSGDAPRPSSGPPDKVFNTPVALYIFEACPEGIWGGEDGSEVYMSPTAAVRVARDILNDWGHRV